MNKTVYTETNIDPDSKYLICKRIKDKWVVQEQHEDISEADSRRSTLAREALINGEITDTLFYRIFFTNHITIKELK